MSPRFKLGALVIALAISGICGDAILQGAGEQKPVGQPLPLWRISRIEPASASSSLDFGVEAFQFRPGVFDSELPIDPALLGVGLV